MQTTQFKRQKGILALILLSLVFASMGLFVRYLNTEFTLLQQVYLRVLAAFFFGLIVFHKNIHFSKIKKLSQRDWGLLTLRSICSYLLGVTLFSKAILLTKYSNVSFIGAIPVVALFGFVLFKEKITLKKILFIITAFLGVFLIAVTDYSAIFSWGKGEIVALIATFFFGLSYVARKWQSDFLNNQEITVMIFLISFMLLCSTSLFLGEGLPITNWTYGLLLAVLGAGAFNTVNMFLTNYGFQHVEAVLASNLLTLESVFAVALGFLFYQEIPAWKELIGGIIIIASVIGMNQEETIK